MARNGREMPRPRRCFLSHATPDTDFADSLADLLARHRIDVFYSAAEYLGLGTWMDQIGQELDRCEWFLAVISPAAAESYWVKHEVQYALSEEKYRGKLIPIRYLEFNVVEVTRRLAWPLRNLDTLDFSDFETGARILLGLWNIQDPV